MNIRQKYIINNFIKKIDQNFLKIINYTNTVIVKLITYSTSNNIVGNGIIYIYNTEDNEIKGIFLNRKEINHIIFNKKNIIIDNENNIRLKFQKEFMLEMNKNDVFKLISLFKL